MVAWGLAESFYKIKTSQPAGPPEADLNFQAWLGAAITDR
jgi:hypothetical protein